MALTTIGSSAGPSRAAWPGPSRGERRDVRGRVFEVALLVCLLVSLLILAALIFTVLTDGLPVYTERGWEFLDGGLSSSAQRAGISQGIVGSFWIAVSVVVLAVPLGIGAAIYLEEYAPRNRFTAFIELNIRNLAGVPSVVYGLLGLAIFVEAMNGFSSNQGVERRTLAAAGVTLAVLVLPIVIITTSEAIRAVPERAAGGGLRRGRHPVGGHPDPGAALRRPGHPHRHAAVDRPGGRRGGAADRRRSGHRVLQPRRRPQRPEPGRPRATSPSGSSPSRRSSPTGRSCPRRSSRSRTRPPRSSPCSCSCCSSTRSPSSCATDSRRRGRHDRPHRHRHRGRHRRVRRSDPGPLPQPEVRHHAADHDTLPVVFEVRDLSVYYGDVPGRARGRRSTCASTRSPRSSARPVAARPPSCGASTA